MRNLACAASDSLSRKSCKRGDRREVNLQKQSRELLFSASSYGWHLFSSYGWKTSAWGKTSVWAQKKVKQQQIEDEGSITPETLIGNSRSSGSRAAFPRTVLDLLDNRKVSTCVYLDQPSTHRSPPQTQDSAGPERGAMSVFCLWLFPFICFLLTFFYISFFSSCCLHFS